MLCAVLAALAWAHGTGLGDSVLIGVSLAVAAVPPGANVRRRPTGEVLDSDRRHALPTDREDRVALRREAPRTDLREPQRPARGAPAVEPFQRAVHG